MKNFLYLTTIISLLFVASACEQKQEVYELTDKVEASFPSTLVSYQMVVEDGNKIVVEMWRGNTKGAVSVPVTITDKTNGVFTPEKNQFDFADGESKAYLAFSYPDLTAFGGEKYEIEITITDENQVSPNGKATIKVSAQRKLTFKSIGKGIFTSEFYGGPWEQEVQKAEEADYYRLPNCYHNPDPKGTAAGYHIEFSVSNGKISFAKQPMGWKHSSYGMVSWEPKYLDYCEISGKTYTFVVNFVVDAGSFGGYYEVLEMP